MSISVTRSQTSSASAMSWVVMRMVRPSSRSSPISPRKSCAATGSMPVVGSSNSTTFGSPIRPRARCRRCFMPRE
ncbi:hypothetical protein JOF41_000155 [Saccharothrix coeruleofusca]|nr:hypothetical protein [Saccharothrix coeruleofusca]MBP2333977.1 hypothetical protein [Saccharothrix coeruleofusca]